MKVCKSEKPEKTFNGFRRYNNWIRFYANTTKANLESKLVLTSEDYDTYAFCVHILEQDAIFYNQLTEDEKECLKYWHYHNPIEKKPILLEFYLKTAYSKYLSVFFSGKEPELNLKILGKQMRLLRTKRNRTKTELGEILGVDRTTVGFYEKGSRCPSLNFVYKFCKYFGCSIDELLKVAIK